MAATHALSSRVKPELRRLSGSGPGPVIVERDIAAAGIGPDIPVIEPARHPLVVLDGPPVTLEVTTAGRRQRARFYRGELVFQPAGLPARPRPLGQETKQRRARPGCLHLFGGQA